MLATHQPRYAFFAGLATAIGAGVSMAFSEGLSDTGDLTGRGNPYLRGAITGAGTFLGGVLHTLPFLIPAYGAALAVALATIAIDTNERRKPVAKNRHRIQASVTSSNAIVASATARAAP